MAFKKYPKVRRPSHSETDSLFASDDHRLVITEKFDGNNYRLCRDGDDLRFGSRNVDLGTDPDEIGGMFEDVTEYLLEMITPSDLAALEEQVRDVAGVSEADVDVVLFGENAVQHTIDDYVWEDVPQFQLFDVWAEWSHPDTGERLDGTWLRWQTTKQPLDVQYVAAYLGLETVPVVDVTTVGAFLDRVELDDYTVPSSVYRPGDKPAEGVVFRNVDTGVKAKYISDEFAEKMESAKSSSMAGADDPHDHWEFLDQHVTKQRIRKNIAKLLERPDNDYDELEMRMMEDLHIVVWRDVWAEDYEDIISTTWTLDLDELHNKVASRCATHLRELIESDTKPVAVVDPETGDQLDEEASAMANN